MRRKMMHAKIHRATVTQADLNYVGSVTIDGDLLDAVGLVQNEVVLIVDNTNGARLETYVIRGERGTGIIGINGAAAHLVDVGDKVIIMGFADVDEEEMKTLQAKVAVLGDDNKIEQMLDYPCL